MHGTTLALYLQSAMVLSILLFLSHRAGAESLRWCVATVGLYMGLKIMYLLGEFNGSSQLWDYRAGRYLLVLLWGYVGTNFVLFMGPLAWHLLNFPDKVDRFLARREARCKEWVASRR